MRFAYKRRGGPLVQWDGRSAPFQSRAGETRSLGDYNIPRGGAPEIIAGYEPPAPGAALVRFGHDCTWQEAHRQAHASMSGYMPEGAARSYGQTSIGADAPAPAGFNPLTSPFVRKLGILASAYHGVKRNNGSIMWGLAWAVAAWAAFPLNGLIVPGFAVAQGFGQVKLKSNPASTKWLKKKWLKASPSKRRRLARRKKARADRTKKVRRTRARTRRYQRRTRRGY
jgi:hypothetical protein